MSFEQLQKQAKELLRARLEGDGSAIERFRKANPRANTEPQADPVLADAQFVIARENGFETWAKLKHHIEGLWPESLQQVEQLVQDLAAAYSSEDRNRVRSVNWKYGTGFGCDFHEISEMHRRLPTWFAAEIRTPELAVADVRTMVARYYGFTDWPAFTRSVNAPGGDPRAVPIFISQRPPFYTIDWQQNQLSVRGPQSERDWATIIDVVKEYRISKLSGGLTDGALKLLSSLDHVTNLEIEGASFTDEGALHLGRMTQLRYLDIGGWHNPITDRALECLRHLPELRTFKMCWTQGVTDAGFANLAFCNEIEEVNLLGTHAGDGAIRALTGKPHLREFANGRSVTDAGLALFHEFPIFKTWHGGEPRMDLMTFAPGPNRLLLDGPFTNKGIASLVGLDGLFGLTFFWHCPEFTSAGLEPLKQLPHLNFLGCQDEHGDDEAMRHIAEMPHLRMLMGQGAVASDEGFEALSRSQTIENIWGRECPNFNSRGFAALANMPALRGLAISCKQVDDAALSRLPDFPVLTGFMPMDVPDAGFRHVGKCENLENLWCMYCRDTGDAATEHVAGLRRLKKYYAGMTLITDHSLEILGQIDSLENLEFWECMGLTDAGAAQIARLPNLREVAFHGLSGITRNVLTIFSPNVRVTYSG